MSECFAASCRAMSSFETGVDIVDPVIMSYLLEYIIRLDFKVKTYSGGPS